MNQKPKIAFSSCPRVRTWHLARKRLEQVKFFKYLGVTFQASGARLEQCRQLATIGERSALNILKFHHSNGAYFIPAALKLFQAKTIAQMLYGTFLGSPTSCFAPLERVQSKFLRALLQVPNCVPNSWIRLEAGLPKVKAKVVFVSISLWLKAH